MKQRNNLKFTEECIMHTEKFAFLKEFVINRLNMGLPLCAWVKKTVHLEKTYRLSRKEKVPGTAVSNEGYADSLSETWKDPSLLFFLKKGTTITRASNCQLLKQNSPYLLNNPCIWFIATVGLNEHWNNVNELEPHQLIHKDTVLYTISLLPSRLGL